MADLKKVVSHLRLLNEASTQTLRSLQDERRTFQHPEVLSHVETMTTFVLVMKLISSSLEQALNEEKEG